MKRTNLTALLIILTAIAAIIYGCGSEPSPEISECPIVPTKNIYTLNASDASSNQYFGEVSISGDTSIVGAIGHSGNGSNSGAAYIYYRNRGCSNDWEEIKILTASDAQADDRFGSRVSVSGNIAIVGASFKSEGGIRRGAAYIFYRNQGGTDNWGQVAKLTPSDPVDDDIFGRMLSISGDFAIVGTPYKHGTGSYRGAAYIFHRNQGGTDNWGQVAKLTPSDAADYDNFGWDISIRGDYAVVGAYGKDNGGFSQGAAYVFYRNQGGTNIWGEVAKLTASDAMDGDEFGTSVDIDGDDVIIGAEGTAPGRWGGTAYIFNRNHGGTDNWGEVKKFTASDIKDSTQFGNSIAIYGDYAVVGAFAADFTADNQGAAYIFYRNQGGADNWGEIAKLIANDPQPGDSFGSSVSISDEFAMISARQKNDLGTNSGTVYLYNLLSF